MACREFFFGNFFYKNIVDYMSTRVYITIAILIYCEILLVLKRLAQVQIHFTEGRFI